MIAKTGKRLANVPDVRAAVAPDAANHNPRAAYARTLVARTGMSQAKIARRLGVGLRTVERWVSVGGMPYPAQHTLESLARTEGNADG